MSRRPDEDLRALWRASRQGREEFGKEFRAISERLFNEGAATLWAAWRQGSKELSQGLVAFPAHSIHPVDELGGFCCPTQLEVNQMEGSYNEWLKGQQDVARELEKSEIGLER
jgi:hypothetical protein